MKRSSNFYKALFIVSFIFILSSCIVNLEFEDEKNLIFSRTSETGAGISNNIDKEIDVVITADPTIIYTSEPTTAQVAVEIFYELMGIQDYAEAYQYLDKHQRNGSVDVFVAVAEELYESYTLLLVQAASAWKSTAFLTDPLNAKTIIEGENCKVFVVEVDIEYKEGMMGAGPSGTYQYVIPVMNRDRGWKLAGFDTIIVPGICKTIYNSIIAFLLL